MSDENYIFRIRLGQTGAPVLFAFHGTGGDESQFFDFSSQLLPDATIVAPRGDVSEHGAARFFRRTGEGVYDMADLARATAKMAAFVEKLRDKHQASRVIGLGFSNGANILANVMIEHGALFNTAALMHPLIPFRPKDNPALAGRKILITAGERDPICPPPLTQSLADYFTRQNATVRLEWHAGGHDIRQNEITAIQQLVA